MRAMSQASPNNYLFFLLLSDSHVSFSMISGGFLNACELLLSTWTIYEEMIPEKLKSVFQTVSPAFVYTETCLLFTCSKFY